MPESPGPREDRQACPEEGRHSLAFIHRVLAPPSVLLDPGDQSCLDGWSQTLPVGFSRSEFYPPPCLDLSVLETREQTGLYDSIGVGFLTYR